MDCNRNDNNYIEIENNRNNDNNKSMDNNRDNEATITGTMTYKKHG